MTMKCGCIGAAFVLLAAGMAYGGATGAVPSFDPSSSGRDNRAALQAMLDRRGTVRLGKPGRYRLSGTVFIGSDTRLECAPGVVLVKVADEEGPFSHVILNRGALTKTWDRNITVDGLEIAVNGVDCLDWQVYGLRGQMAFHYAKDVKVTRFRCLDLGRAQYCLHFCNFEDVIVDDVRIEGLKDGVHFGTGRRFTVRNGVFDTGDDPIALNAHDYSTGNPELGWIEDGVVENCHDLYTGTRHVGFFCRILAGAWRDWFEGMDVQQSDTVVSDGNVYRVQMPVVDGKHYVSRTRPTHASGQATLDGGIVWGFVQSNALHTCGVRNVMFRDIYLHQPRTAFSVHYDSGRHSRSYYPGAEISWQENLFFDNIRLLHDAKLPFLSVSAPVRNIRFSENCTPAPGSVVTNRLAASLMRSADADLASFVDPFIGTAGPGHAFPGACVPFGLVQASPDTGNESWDYCGGYQFADRSIFGFSQTHLNGTGGKDLGDLLLLPFVSGDGSQKEPIDKASERAEPGFYSVRLSDADIRADVAASAHAAIYRFTAGAKGGMKLLVDCQWGLVNVGRRNAYVLAAEVTHDDSGVDGWRRTANWNVRETGFAVRFSRPARSCTELPRRKGERAPRYVFDFDVKPGEALLAKIGLTAGDGAGDVRGLPERARKNLEAEIPAWDFEAVKGAARARWNDLLSKAVVEGTADQKKNWYTSLYHLFIQPNNLGDVGARPFYSSLSTWDTFRAAGPLYTILVPDKAAEFVDSMLEQGRRTGYLPIWTLWGRDNQCMIGTHSIPMIVDWFLKEQVKVKGEGEQRKFDLDYWQSAYAQIKETLTGEHKGRRKENWDLYDRYGYYPFDRIKGESVSRTMECAYDDWCAAQMAKALGKDEDAAFFLKRAGYWKNVFDPSIGMVRGKGSDGKWREPFNPFALGHGADLANDFTEGNAFQYTWHVMQDPQGLVAAMGGRERFAEKLDALFTAPDKVDGAGCVVDVTGLIGQYVHGNEPSHHVIYFYPQVGQPEKAADRIREVFDRFYLPKADGLCGNDDCGQMSAWYLFSAMGFYPFNPCGGEYIIGAPQLPKVTLRCQPQPSTSTSFTVIAKNLSKENKYVKSVTLNGKPITDWRISHADIMRGGCLEFVMQNMEK